MAKIFPNLKISMLDPRNSMNHAINTKPSVPAHCSQTTESQK